MGLSLNFARRILAEVEPYNIANFEDPVATFYEMAQLRQHSRISVLHPRTRPQVGRASWRPGYLRSEYDATGGIARTMKKFVAACEEMGVGFWCYSGDAGVGSAAYLHVVAATHHIAQASQSLFRWQVDDVIEEDRSNRHTTCSRSRELGLDSALHSRQQRWNAATNVSAMKGRTTSSITPSSRAGTFACRWPELKAEPLPEDRRVHHRLLYG